MVKTLLLRWNLVKCDEIKNIEIIYPKNNSIKIKIYDYVDTYSQIYHTSDEKHLLKLVPRYLAQNNIRVLIHPSSSNKSSATILFL